MSTTVLPERPAAPARRLVVGSLARVEALRMLRSPWLLVGGVLTALLARDWSGWQDWSGQRYGSWFLVPAGLYLATSLVVATSFHRERAALAEDAPAGATDRALGRLLASGVLVVLTAAFVAGFAVYLRSIDGLDLGDEPGRTLHALPTLAELSQPVAATVLAVAVGALAGRRLRHLTTAVLLLMIGWLPVTMTYWAFQAPVVAPFSVLQDQPVSVDVGSPATDPLSYPADWLLSAPGEYQDHWARLVVSESLAWWHTGWLLGLAALLLAFALPHGRARRVLTTAGTAVAVVSVVAQFLVYPA